MDLEKLDALMELMHKHGAHFVKAGDVEVQLMPRHEAPAADTGPSEEVPILQNPLLYPDGVVPGMTIED